MKFGFVMIILLGLPALVAAQGSCANRSPGVIQAERAAPVGRYAAWDQWLLVEPQLL